MTTSTNVQVEVESHADAMIRTEIPAIRRLYWSVRRELWEHRSIYLAPAVAAAVVLIGFFISLIWLPERVRDAMALSPIERHEAIEQPYVIVALVLMLIGLLVAVFYCLDALYGERRDRSILFWKSLPASDLITVLGKASIPVLVVPLVTFAVTIVTHLVMLLASGAVLTLSGMSAAVLWTHVPFFEAAAINFAHLLGFHGIWYAPFYGWLLMVSAWAKRAPIIWAVLPPVAIGIVEKLAFNTSYFTEMVQNRFLVGPEIAESGVRLTIDVLAPHPMGQFATSPGLWGGLAVTAIFLFAAVRLHRSRGPL